jgi:YD repeat-containing protein
MCIDKTKSFILILGFIILLNEWAFSQSQAVKGPVYPSPNAASLGKYGDIPVSYHTGVPEISIPIYTIAEGSIAVPISLNYHSSGIQVDEVASWVGLGWTLMAGGSITRVVKGGPDEGAVAPMPGAHSSFVGWGWYKDQGILPEIIDCSYRPLSTEGPVAGTQPAYGGCGRLYYEASKGYIDCEPDLFTMSFGGHSGKFYFEANRQVRMMPESDYYIEPINTPSTFFAWKVIAPDGTKYFFGGAATEVSSSDMTSTNGNKEVASTRTWYLYRIESANGEDWVSFEYEDETYSFGNRAGHSLTFGDCDVCGESIQGDIQNASPIISLSVVDGKRLSAIRTSSGHTSVDLIPSQSFREDLTLFDKTIPNYTSTGANNNASSLQFIEINAGSKCKKFELSTDYFSSAACPGYPSAETFDKKRLRLNWVQESTCDGQIHLPKHEFFYDPTLLPRRYSLARDMFGYYNGFDTNTGLLETFVRPFSEMTYTTTNHRTVTESKLQAGILKKIVFPTGGYSEFEYEPHRETTSSPAVGGIRIKTITTSDNLGNSSVKNISYPQGKLYFNPEFFLFQFPANNAWTTGAYLGSLLFGSFLSSDPMPPLHSSQGYHIGYSKVVIDETGNGSTTYTYLNTSPTTINGGQFPLKPLVSDPGTSEMTSHEIKDNSGNIVSGGYFSPVKTGTDKTTYARKVAYVYCLNCNGAPGQGPVERNYGLWNDYSINTYRFNLTEKSETRDGVTIVTTYTYDAAEKHNNPVTSQFTDSKGVIHKTEYVFASDVGSGAPAAMYNTTDTNFKNMLGATVEQRSLVNNVLKSKSTVQFTQSGSNILPTSSRNYPSGTTEFIEDSYQYDDKLNVKSILKSNGVNKAFLWGYNDNLPIAAVENATYQESLVALNQAFGLNPAANTSSCTTLSGSFTINEDQTVSFSPSISLNGATGLWVKLTMKNGSGNTVFGPRQYAANGTYNESVFLTAGTYTFCYEAGGYPTPYNGYSSVGFTMNGFTARRANLFHTSFEENGIGAAALSGSKVLSGTYAVNMPHINGDYILSYWKRPDTGTPSWEYVEVPITISSSTTPPYVVGQSGYYLDEVRLFPKGALMSTYTYDPGLGMTSATDPNNITSYYQYDAFGRLITMKNDKGEIVKTYQYHLKNQN